MNITIGRHECAVYPRIEYNAVMLVARGPRFKGRAAIKLHCMVSDEILDQLGYDGVAPMIARQFDQAYNDAYRYAPIMRRKMRRLARGLR